MTSKRFTLLLVFTFSFLACGISHAMSQMYRMRMHIINSSNKTLTICPKGPGNCAVVKPGDNVSSAYPEDDEPKKKLAAWVAKFQLEVCGKKVSLDALPVLRAFKKLEGGTFTSYAAAITDQDIAPLCDGAAE